MRTRVLSCCRLYTALGAARVGPVESTGVITLPNVLGVESWLDSFKVVVVPDWLVAFPRHRCSIPLNRMPANSGCLRSSRSSRKGEIPCFGDRVFRVYCPCRCICSWPAPSNRRPTLLRATPSRRSRGSSRVTSVSTKRLPLASTRSMPA